MNIPDHSLLDIAEEADARNAITPAEALDSLGAIWSDDLDAYMNGERDASKLHCALCQCAPCRCPEFGTDAYFALLDQRHGRTR
jgi:hypothetical protein